MQLLRTVSCARAPLALALSLALLATACNGGARPTLTGDRLDDSALTTADDIGQQAAQAAAEAESAPETDAAEPATSTPDVADSATNSPPPTLAPGEVEQLFVEVIETFPHDATAFTQGLELHDGDFFESTGSRGPGNTLLDSTLRRVDPATGQVEQSVSIEQPFFAEGLTKVGDELIQLTWQDGVAFYWDATTFELLRTVPYAGEGWGLCYDGAQLIMTDGTPSITLRDAATFAEITRLTVTVNGEPVDNLNEIECVNGSVWANIFLSQQIVRIDPATGNVTAIVDATALAGPEGEGNAVLNGIAWDETTQSFFLTGKLWPTMYRVNFVADPSS